MLCLWSALEVSYSNSHTAAVLRARTERTFSSLHHIQRSLELRLSFRLDFVLEVSAYTTTSISACTRANEKKLLSASCTMLDECDIEAQRAEGVNENGDLTRRVFTPCRVNNKWMCMSISCCCMME